MEKFDFFVFYFNIKDKIKELIVLYLFIKKGLKWYFVMRVEFIREREGQVEKVLFYFCIIVYRYLILEEFNFYNINEFF